MSGLVLLLRFTHVVAGTLWVGFAVFVATYLGPAIQEAGPDGGKVMAALQRRGLMNVLPALALLTILSGTWLMWHDAAISGGAFMRSPAGMVFGIGSLVALAGFAVGMTLLRPSMLRVLAIMASVPSAAAADRERLLAEAQRYRARGAAAGRVVAALLLIATVAMAVARYL
jgi:hypothetical protein